MGRGLQSLGRLGLQGGGVEIQSKGATVGITRAPKARVAAVPPPRGGRTYTCDHPGGTAATLALRFWGQERRVTVPLAFRPSGC